MDLRENRKTLLEPLSHESNGGLHSSLIIPMADYEHHIFVSYRRWDRPWVRWTRENFAEPLGSILSPALGNVKIFADEKLDVGVSWPLELARAHTHSRLLIPILSRDYFRSGWCRLELALMYHRQKERRYRAVDEEHVLILPLVIDDGESFPPEVQEMQRFERIPREFTNPFMRPDSRRQEEFADWLMSTCRERVIDALDKVPQFQAGWGQVAHDQFKEMFRIKIGAQKTLPKLALLPISK